MRLHVHMHTQLENGNGELGVDPPPMCQLVKFVTSNLSS